MKYEIFGRLNDGQPGSIDEADSKEEADYLIGEYRLAFSSGWSIWCESRAETAKEDRSLRENQEQL